MRIEADPRGRQRPLAKGILGAASVLIVLGLGAVLSPWVFPKQGQIPLIILPGAAVLVLGLVVGAVGVLLAVGSGRRGG